MVLQKLFDQTAPALSCVKFFRKEIPQRCAQKCTNFARTGQGPTFGLFAAPILSGLALHPHRVYVLAGSLVGVGAPSLLLETSDMPHTQFPVSDKGGCSRRSQMLSIVDSGLPQRGRSEECLAVPTTPVLRQALRLRGAHPRNSILAMFGLGGRPSRGCPA